MRFLWTYLIVVIVFAFGFIWASMFTVGMPPPRRAPRGAEPNMSNFYQEQARLPRHLVTHGHEGLVAKGPASAYKPGRAVARG